MSQKTAPSQKKAAATVTFKVDRPQDPCATCLLDCEPVSSQLYEGADFLVVGRQPSERMVSEDRNLSTSAMHLFAKHMKANGFKARQFAYHNAIRCHYDPDTVSRKDRTSIYHSCKEYFLRAVDRIRPKVIICLGADAARQVMNREVKITKDRGHVFQTAITISTSEQHHCIVIPVMDPANFAAYPQQEKLLSIDAKTLRLLVDADYNMQQVEARTRGEYIEVDDLQFLVDQEPEILSFDIETTGLDPHADDAAILCMQFCTRVGEAYFLGIDHPQARKSMRQKARLKKQLRALFARKQTKVIGHNLAFDVGYVHVIMGVDITIGNDTLVMYSMLDEESHNKDLSTLTKLFVPERHGYADYLERTYSKSKMAEVPIYEMIDYACGDVEAVYLLFHVLEPMLKQDKGSYRSYRNVTLPGMNAFQRMHQRGMLIDTEALQAFEDELSAKVEADNDELLAQVPRSIKEKHVEKGLKFSRPDFVRDILFDHPDGFKLEPRAFTKTTAKLAPEFRKASISSKEHLPFHFDACPFAAQLAVHVKNARMLGTNVRSFRKKYVHDDGRIYPQFLFHVATTGRIATRNPNSANIPARGPLSKSYKKIFIPEDGYAFVAADLSQAELRFAADMAQEKVMLRAYAENKDIHAITAMAVMGTTEREWVRLEPDTRDFKRFSAKAVGFGFLFGMWWKKFKIYAKTQYGLEFTDEEAQHAREAFFDRYPGLGPWHVRMKEQAHRNGQVRLYCGRLRHLEGLKSSEDWIVQEAERQAINSPVQGSSSQYAVRAIVDFDRYMRKHNPEITVVNFVHDAIYARCPMHLVEYTAKHLKRCMETVDTERWWKRRLRVPMVADAAFGMNMGELHEMKTLQLDKRYDFGQHEVDFVLPRQEI